MPKISICQSPSRTSLLLVVQHAQKLHRLLLPPPRTTLTLIGAVFPVLVLVASGSRLTHLVQPHTRIQQLGKHGQTNSYHLKTSQQVLPIRIPETNRKSLSVPSLEPKNGCHLDGNFFKAILSTSTTFRVPGPGPKCSCQKFAEVVALVVGDNITLSQNGN